VALLPGLLWITACKRRTQTSPVDPGSVLTRIPTDTLTPTQTPTPNLTQTFLAYTKTVTPTITGTTTRTFTGTWTPTHTVTQTFTPDPVVIDDFEDGTPFTSLQAEAWVKYDDAGSGGSSSITLSELSAGAPVGTQYLESAGTLVAGIDFGGVYVGWAGMYITMTGVFADQYSDLRYYLKGSMPGVVGQETNCPQH